MEEDFGLFFVQKEYFIGDWEMVHDGWKGELKLYYDLVPYGEFAPRIAGEYVSSNGTVSKVTGSFIWDKIHGMKIKIYSEDGTNQEYELYFFTKTKDEMAGITHWNNMPFGVSLYKKEKAYFDGVREGEHVAPYIGGTYSMNHDGWPGEITFIDLGNGSLTGSYTSLIDGSTHTVSGTYSGYGASNPYIVNFSIDDDQEYEVYLFTQTKEGMAGITHWNGIPFGVRLTHLHN